MNFLTDPTYWLIAGLLLILAELIIPGGIVVFLGLGCLVVALAVHFGLVTTWMGACTLFFIASLAMILLLRQFAVKFVEGDSSRGNTDELLDDVGEIAIVVDSIGPGNKQGRILFRGTQWPALGDGSELQVDAQVQIVSRQNVSYIVEKCEASTGR